MNPHMFTTCLVAVLRLARVVSSRGRPPVRIVTVSARFRPAIVLLVVCLLVGAGVARRGHAAWIVEADAVNITFGAEGADGVPGTGDDLPPGSLGISSGYNDGLFDAGGTSFTSWVIMLTTAVPLGGGSWQYDWIIVNLGSGQFEQYSDDGGGPNFLQGPPLEASGSFEADSRIGGPPELGLWGGSWYVDVVAPGGATLYRPTADCGNGIVTGGEQCDDGNLVDGDGCDSNCTLTGCGNGVVTSGEECDDGNNVGGDCCSANCTLETGGCDDGNACTTADTCAAGACVGGDPPNCDDGDVCTDDSCDSQLGCVNTPIVGCGSTTTTTTTTLPSLCGNVAFVGCKGSAAARSRLQIKVNVGDPRKNQLKFKYSRGEATLLDEYGDPVNGFAEYRLCVWDDSASGQPLLDAAVLPGGVCGSKPCWKATGTKGIKFKDKTGTPEGIQQVKVKADGRPEKTRISVKAKGTNLGAPALPLTPTVTAQFIVDDGEVRCWEVPFTTAIKNDDQRFKAKGP